MILKKSDIKKLYEAGTDFYAALDGEDDREWAAFSKASREIARNANADYGGKIYRDLVNAVYERVVSEPVDMLCEVLDALWVDVDFGNDATLGKAIAMLRAEYELAINHPFVYNPIGYALYKTWEKFGKGEEKHES